MPLMHHDDGTRGRRVTLRVDGRSVSILRRELQIARDGRMDDLTEMPDKVADAGRTRRQVKEYDRLLRQLAAADVLTGERDALRALLVDLSAGTDAAEEYARLAAEHHAFRHLLDQLDAAEGGNA
jgi:hypothetical protein